MLQGVEISNHSFTQAIEHGLVIKSKGGNKGLFTLQKPKRLAALDILAETCQRLAFLQAVLSSGDGLELGEGAQQGLQILLKDVENSLLQVAGEV